MGGSHLHLTRVMLKAARVKQRESGEEFKYKVLIEEAEKEYALAEELCCKEDLESAMEHVRTLKDY